MLATALKAKRFAPPRLGDANRKTQHKYLLASFLVSRTGFPQQPLLCGILRPLELSGGFTASQEPEQGGAQAPRGSIASKLSTRQAEQVLRRSYDVFHGA